MKNNVHSLYTCAGYIAREPRRRYSKSNIEVSNFQVMVKDNYWKGKNHYDVFMFEAWKETANYINSYLHAGDYVHFVARPRNYCYKKKNGTMVESILFRVIEIEFISHRQRKLLNQFGGLDVKEFSNTDVFDL